MQEIRRQVPTFKAVESGHFTEMTFFVAEDGKEFLSKSGCVDHEVKFFETKLNSQLKTNTKPVLRDLEESWHYIKTESDLEVVLKLLELYKEQRYKVVHVYEFALESWILFKWDYDDYSGGNYLYVYTLEGIKEQIEGFLKDFE